MSPELKILAINATFLAFAYFWAYPRIPEPTGIKLLWRDAVITLAALMVGALLFLGSGVWFAMGPIETNWFIFQLITFAAMETPLFLWFAWRHDLEF